MVDSLNERQVTGEPEPLSSRVHGKGGRHTDKPSHLVSEKMAFDHPAGLTPPEIAFICEMELVTIVPRQRLDRLDLQGGPTAPLIPPQRSLLPLWLALLLKRQRRADIVPPPWLHPTSLREILELETTHFPDSFSPPPPLPATRTTKSSARPFHTSAPFLPSSTAEASAEALPYHWLEIGQILLDSAADDVVEPDRARQLLRDLREVRAAKMRKGIERLTGEANKIRLDGVGAMEVGEGRGFITGVVDGLMKLGASTEQARKEREAEEGENGYNADAGEEEMEY